MFTSVGLGALPSNLTTPLIVEVLPVEGKGSPAFTTGWLEMKISNVKAESRESMFLVM
jgi:hypothetical protein